VLELLDEDGVDDIGLVEELAAPPAELEEAAPVPPGVVVASAPGAGDGVGAGVVLDELDELGALGELGALDAGGVTTLDSSFLQAVRPTATSAAMMSERVMFFSFRRRGSRYKSATVKLDQRTP
jgi:hypothetical protein